MPFFNRILTPFGWFVFLAILGMITGLCTGLYSCRHTLKEAVVYETQELPIAHSFEEIQPDKVEIPKREKLKKEVKK